MTAKKKPRAIAATDVPVRQKPSSYPAPFAGCIEGRMKRPLGTAFGLQNFGVNLTELAPGAQSALLHRHTRQDEFVFILEGEATLRTEQDEQTLGPGMCVGFPAAGEAHHLVNRSSEPVRYLEIGDRTPGDQGEYPEDDLAAVMRDGAWTFTRKDGTPYD